MRNLTENEYDHVCGGGVIAGGGSSWSSGKPKKGQSGSNRVGPEKFKIADTTLYGVKVNTSRNTSVSAGVSRGGHVKAGASIQIRF